MEENTKKENKYASLVSDGREPFAMFGFELRKGWRPIAERVLDKILEYNNKLSDSKIYVDQVKEKFAGLRIYVTYQNVPENIIKAVNELIDEAEAEAAKTCELCGTKENVGMRVKGWYTVMCEDCAREEVKKHIKEGLIYKDGITWKRASDGKTFLVTEKETKEL